MEVLGGVADAGVFAAGFFALGFGEGERDFFFGSAFGLSSPAAEFESPGPVPFFSGSPLDFLATLVVFE
jgi:hypothetical protein